MSPVAAADDAASRSSSARGVSHSALRESLRSSTSARALRQADPPSGTAADIGAREDARNAERPQGADEVAWKLTPSGVLEGSADDRRLTVARRARRAWRRRRSVIRAPAAAGSLDQLSTPRQTARLRCLPYAGRSRQQSRIGTQPSMGAYPPRRRHELRPGPHLGRRCSSSLPQSPRGARSG